MQKIKETELKMHPVRVKADSQGARKCIKVMETCTQSGRSHVVRVQKTQKKDGKMHPVRAKTGGQGAENV